MFQLWNWVELDMSKIRDILEQLRLAISPGAQEPASIDFWLLSGLLQEPGNT